MEEGLFVFSRFLAVPELCKLAIGLLITPYTQKNIFTDTL
jgi:hypothetical protein